MTPFLTNNEIAGCGLQLLRNSSRNNKQKKVSFAVPVTMKRFRKKDIFSTIYFIDNDLQIPFRIKST